MSGRQPNLCGGVWASTGFIVGSKGSSGGVRRIDLAVALVDCNAQLPVVSIASLVSTL
jgi:hypothetical protein